MSHRDENNGSPPSEEVKRETGLPPATAAQIHRATSLLDLAESTEDLNTKFTLCVAALHLARAVPEYWFTVADNIPIELGKAGKKRSDLACRLRAEFDEIFKTARRYDLLSRLRDWDYHWEPLINPLTVPPNLTYGRGAPLRLSTGGSPNSSVAYFGHGKLVSTGSGHRVGRSNYHQIRNNRFVDAERGEALPLGLAVRQFIEDLPRCIVEITQKPEVIQYTSARR
jgi:hypothetical protein